MKVTMTSSLNFLALSLGLIMLNVWFAETQANQMQQFSPSSSIPQQFPPSSPLLPLPFSPSPSFQPQIQRNYGGISTHVLDIASGRPAANVNCSVFWWDEGRQNWVLVGIGRTNEQGRVDSVIASELLPLNSGAYKIRFETAHYFGILGQSTFFPFIEVAFMVNDPSQKYHIPLTLSNYGYSTYRGQ